MKLFLTQVRDESREFLYTRYDWNQELGVKGGDKNSWCGERRKEQKPVEKGAMGMERANEQARCLILHFKEDVAIFIESKHWVLGNFKFPDSQRSVKITSVPGRKSISGHLLRKSQVWGYSSEVNPLSQIFLIWSLFLQFSISFFCVVPEFLDIRATYKLLGELMESSFALARLVSVPPERIKICPFSPFPSHLPLLSPSVPLSLSLSFSCG